MVTYIKLNRSNEYRFLIKKSYAAFSLLSIIADRAKRTDDHPDKSLKIGEARIGDYQNYGMKRATYRNAIKWLTRNHQITIKPTNKGTVAKIVSTTIFDINPESPDQQETNKRPTKDQQETIKLTTNNNVLLKNDKNDNNTREVSNNPIVNDPIFQELLKVYHPQNDIETRKKMVYEEMLSSRYPASSFKYSGFWGEARQKLTRGGN